MRQNDIIASNCHYLLSHDAVINHDYNALLPHKTMITSYTCTQSWQELGDVNTNDNLISFCCRSTV